MTIVSYDPSDSLRRPDRRGEPAFCTVEELGVLIRGLQSFVLTSHVNPDGDALGSELAFARMLRAMGKTAAIVNYSPTPENYRWIDPDGEIAVFDPARHADLLRTADAIVVLDTNHPERLRTMQDHVVSSPARKFVIDHHLEPHPFAHHYLVDTEATSTGEIVYRIVMALRPEGLTRDIARPLYAAVMTDTGSFRFPRTVGDTFRIAGHLVDAGADPTEIFSRIYETWTPGRMRLLGEVLDSMRTLYDGRLAYVVATQETFRTTGTSEEDTDNFTVYPMSVQNVLIGILFVELKDGVKISFRSRSLIPVNELAKEFGGGGHRNAAGARLHYGGIDEVVRAITSRAARYLNGASVEKL